MAPDFVINASILDMYLGRIINKEHFQDLHTQLWSSLFRS